MKTKYPGVLLLIALLVFAASAQAQQEVLPRPEQPFNGKIGRTAKDSTPDFPKGIEAPKSAPNVLLIMTDDVGFGASSVFGGPIQTPNFQRLADSGLRYNMFHTTALCSPTRAALITGRNHHSVASGVITEMATGFPGYNSLVPKSAGSVGEVLKQNGYNTFWFGKMHNVPDWMSSAAGPFDLWPTGLGFEYFYGFIRGDSDQWHPALFENTTPIEPYLGKPDYIFDHDMADNTLIFFIMGDNGASPEGSLQGTTDEIGVNQGVKESIPFLVSMIDELGGPHGYNHYPVGWAHAMDTPMQWTKQVASHFGGTRNGLVISWPARIKPPQTGGLRSQFCHVIDIVPTIYEAAGITPPDVLNGVKQKPIEGTSLVYTFDQPKAPTQHPVQYFELVGNRAIYKDGWMASTTPLRLPWMTTAEVSPDDFKWELYNINNDFSQAHNLAAQNPEKLKELQAAFDVEAKKYNVYPIDSSFTARFDTSIRPSLTRGRTEFVYYPGMIRIPEGSAPDFKNKSWTAAAEVTLPEGGASGVLATIGGRFGGWAMWLDDSKPRFAYALSNQKEHKFIAASDTALAPGDHVIRVKFQYAGGGAGKGGTATSLVDEKEVAKVDVPATLFARISLDETFDVGEDTGTPIVDDYEAKMPYAFTGTLKRLGVVLEPENLSPEDKQKLREAIGKVLMGSH